MVIGCDSNSPDEMNLEFQVTRNSSALSNPSGPYNIGTIEMELVDSSRPDLYRNAGDRRLMVQFWYPTKDDTSSGFAPYMHPNIVELFSLFQDYTDPQTMISFVSNMGTNAIQSASINTDDKLPVVFFSHGFTGTRNLYSTIIEDLASRGYMVIGIDHSFGAFATVFPDGSLILASATQPTFPELVSIWTDDVIFVLDKVQNDELGDTFGISSSVDVNQVAMIGHSTGGSAAAELAVKDARLDAGISLDAPQAGAPLTNTISQPFFLFFDDDSQYYDTQVQANLQGPAFEMIINQTSHYSFTDLPLLLKRAGIAPAASGVWDRPPGFIDGDRNLEIQLSYTNSFIDKFLLSQGGDLLSGPSPDFTDVSFTVLNAATAVHENPRSFEFEIPKILPTPYR